MVKWFSRALLVVIILYSGLLMKGLAVLRSEMTESLKATLVGKPVTRDKDKIELYNLLEEYMKDNHIAWIEFIEAYQVFFLLLMGYAAARILGWILNNRVSRDTR